MFIFELCGLPGVGKSTFCNTFERGLKESGYKVINVQKQPLWYGKIKRRLFKVILRTDGDCRRLLKKAYKELPDMSDKAKKYWVERIVQSIYLTKRAAKKGYEVVTLDEGYIQFVTSLCHGEEISEPYIDFYKSITTVVDKCGKHYVVDCRLDKEIIVERLKKRGRQGDRFLADSDGEIYSRLSLKDSNLRILNELVDADRRISVELKSSEKAIENILATVNRR